VTHLCLNRLTTIGCIELWQTGVRVLFVKCQDRRGWCRSYTWAKISQQIKLVTPDATASELDLIKTILYKQHNITYLEGETLFRKYRSRHPLIDALEALM